MHKLVLQSKINETKDVMKRKASEIDKSKIEKSRGDKGGFGPLQLMGSGRIENSFSDLSISSSGTGFESGSGFGLTSDVDSFATKPKGHPTSSATAPPKGLGMKLESLKAKGEVILEDVQPKHSESWVVAPQLTDPITLTVEEKLNSKEVCQPMNPTTGIKNENVPLSITNGLLAEPIKNGSRGRHVDSLHHVEPRNDTNILGGLTLWVIEVNRHRDNHIPYGVECLAAWSFTAMLISYFVSRKGTSGGVVQ
uniref:Coatomer subunit delta n=1 Tax=Glycine max TaxID=3847 RepID=A0A0R0IE73_SOYBN